MRWLTLASAALLAGCSQFERPSYTEPDPVPIQLPERPPDKIMRRPPDFTFKDYTTGSQYYYRLYTDSDVKLEIITVLKPGAEAEVGASPEETDYAFKVLTEDWLSKGLQERLDHHRLLHERERQRRDAGLEERMYYAQRAIAQLEDTIFTLQADLDSCRQTPGYQAKPGHLEFLEKEIAVQRIALIEEKARLDSFRYLKAVRDQRYLRSSRVTAP